MKRTLSYVNRARNDLRQRFWTERDYLISRIKSISFCFYDEWFIQRAIVGNRKDIQIIVGFDYKSENGTRNRTNKLFNLNGKRSNIIKTLLTTLKRWTTIIKL